MLDRSGQSLISAANERRAHERADIPRELLMLRWPSDHDARFGWARIVTTRRGSAASPHALASTTADATTNGSIPPPMSSHTVWTARVSAWIGRASDSGRRELAILYRLLKHPDTPWTIRAIATVAVGYVVSPIQFIPSFIPVIGQLDDVCVLFVATRLIRALVDPALLAECSDSHAPPPPLKLLAGVAVVGALIVALSVHMI